MLVANPLCWFLSWRGSLMVYKPVIELTSHIFISQSTGVPSPSPNKTSIRKEWTLNYNLRKTAIPLFTKLDKWHIFPDDARIDFIRFITCHVLNRIKCITLSKSVWVLQTCCREYVPIYINIEDKYVYIFLTLADSIMFRKGHSDPVRPPVNNCKKHNYLHCINVNQLITMILVSC
jgi:hypothetical protein